jgi:endonuclease/exonuclease/phosphatase family metal-dependent hydrolase
MSDPAAAASERVLRLLSCNILAGASVQRYHQYVTRSWASVLPARAKQDNLDRLAHSSNGLISRLEPSEVLDYPLPGRITARGVVLAGIGQGREALAVAVAHLSLGPQARARQLGFIGELLEGQTHVVMMGDLNTEAGRAEMRDLFRRTALQPPGSATPTFPSWQPRRAIDHILLSGGLRLHKAWTLSEAFSDHLPLAAEISMPPGLA